MKGTVPTLSLDGFVNNKNIQVSKLFLYFLSSKFSQSNTYYGDIVSLDYILAKYNNPVELKTQILDALNKLYKRHFDRVDLDVKVEVSNADTKINIYIDGTLTDNNTTYTLTKEFSVSGADIDSYVTLLDQFYYEYMGEQ